MDERDGKNPGKAISYLHRKSLLFWTKRLRQYGLTAAEYPVLIVLNNQDGLTQEEITGRLELDKSAVARLLQSLQRKGFVEKQKDQADKRCNHIFLTEMGRESRSYIDEGRQEWNDILGNGMTEQEKEMLGVLLEKMLGNIRERQGQNATDK